MWVACACEFIGALVTNGYFVQLSPKVLAYVICSLVLLKMNLNGNDECNYGIPVRGTGRNWKGHSRKGIILAFICFPLDDPSVVNISCALHISPSSLCEVR